MPPVINRNAWVRVIFELNRIAGQISFNVPSNACDGTSGALTQTIAF
jgi:hypothetical protein